MRVTEPLHLSPTLVPKPWGGRALAAFGRDLPAEGDIGESWEVADLAPDAATSTSVAVTTVATGPHAGATLAELIAADPDGLLGDARAADGRFPLLVKLLDAREPLSVQVHPTPAYAAAHPPAAVKTESWVVVDAADGAELLLGLATGVTRADLRAAAGTPSMPSLLRRVPARPGDVHHLPAGTIHALGAGVVVAEVQTPSDTTYRLYDWTDELGREPRELHLDAALACIEQAWDANTAPLARPPAAPAVPSGEPSVEVVVTTPSYVLRRHLLPDGAAMTLPAARAPGDGAPVGRVPRALQVLTGRVTGDAFAWPLERGGTVLLPAAWSGHVHAATGDGTPSTVLETVVLGVPAAG